MTHCSTRRQAAERTRSPAPATDGTRRPWSDIAQCARRAAVLCVVLTAVPCAGQGVQPPRAPDAIVAKVQAAVSQSDASAAAAVASQALTAYPEDPDLHNLAGVASARQGDVSAAERHFQRAIALAPRSAGAYENLGRLYQERAATDPAAAKSAIDVYRQWLRIEPSSAEASYQLAFVLTNAGAFGEGVTTIERLPAALLSEPHVAAVHVAALQGSGHGTRAMTLARQLARDPALTEADVLRLAPAFEKSTSTDATLVLMEALAGRPGAAPDVLRALAHVKTRVGDLPGARETLERAFGAAAPNAATLVDLARVAYRQRDFAGALGYLAHARTLEPSNARIHFFFGIACIELNLGSEAYESLKKAIALDPDNPAINYVLGAVAIHRHERAEAIPYFERYVQLAPDDPRGRFALGVAYFYSDDFDRAKQALTEAAAHPETAAGAQYFLGGIARRQNDLESARQHLEDAVRRVPGYADARAELGLIYTRQGRFDEAEASLRQALTLDPDNYAATVNLTALYTRTRDPRKEEMAARLEKVQQKRADEAQEFLRIVDFVP
jgi:Flp pilus assembly protein TadD